jgi:hypothetical protein
MARSPAGWCARLLGQTASRRIFDQKSVTSRAGSGLQAGVDPPALSPSAIWVVVTSRWPASLPGPEDAPLPVRFGARQGALSALTPVAYNSHNALYASQDATWIDASWGPTIIGPESRVKLLTPVERPRHADFRIPVITMKSRLSGRFISAGEYRGSGLGFL